MYSWVYLKIFLVIPWRPYKLLTFQQRITEFTWKFSYFEETVLTDHITTTYSWSNLKMFVVRLRTQYLILTFLLCTSEVFWKMSISENVRNSEEAVNNPQIPTTYSGVILKMFLFIQRRQYILLTLLRCTLCFPGNVLIYCVETIPTFHITTIYRLFFWKCSWLFCGDCRDCSHFYYVHLSYSENVLIFSVETVHIPHNTAMYSYVFQNMFLFILRRPYILLT